MRISKHERQAEADAVDAEGPPVLAPANPEAALASLAARYEADRMRWQLPVSAGGVGSFDWDLVSGRLEWDDQLLEIFGIARDDFGSTIEAFNATLDPDDLPRVSEALQAAIATCTRAFASGERTRLALDGSEC